MPARRGLPRRPAAERAIELDPTETTAWRIRSQAVHRKGEPGRSYDIDQEGLKAIEPTTARDYAIRGWLHQDHENYAAAVNEYTEALKRRPHTVSYLLARARLHSRLYQQTEANALQAQADASRAEAENAQTRAAQADADRGEALDRAADARDTIRDNY